jgi:phenylalanine-4-hydroxylase
MHEDITILELDHPGAKDQLYRKRRDRIASVARRSHRKQIPKMHYTKNENATWHIATTKLTELHRKLASNAYKKASELIALPYDHVPQLNDVSNKLSRFQGVQLDLVEGLVDTRVFMRNLSNGIMSCTQYIRHHSRPEYTPEPDVIHEVIGHVPMFANKEFVAFSKMLGRASLNANNDQLTMLERIYWFTIEFGLIEEQGETRVFGAGLLSSFGEMPHALSSHVERKPFSIKEIIDTEYGYSEMQIKLFVIPSFKELAHATRAFLKEQGLV